MLEVRLDRAQVPQFHVPGLDVEPAPPEDEWSDVLLSLESQTSCILPSSVPEAQEHKAEARRAPARRNVAVKTGASGPKPKVPGALDFPGVFCL